MGKGVLGFLGGEDVLLAKVLQVAAVAKTTQSFPYG